MPNTKSLPFDEATIKAIAEKYPTPFYLYDEKGIRETCRQLNSAFSWVDGFRNYFAVKATPNPHILQIVKEEGLGGDCSSPAELTLCDKVGLHGEEIMFTSNNTPASEYKAAKDVGAVINLDDISHIDYADKTVGLPELVSFRYNPGPARTGNVIIGNPSEAKYGFTEAQLFEGYEMLKQRGVKRFALHTMVASNELDGSFFVETSRMLFDLAIRIQKQVGVRIEFVNLGGGIGIPYRPEESPVDLAKLGSEVRALYEEMIVPAGLDPLRVVLENGRVITGPHGYLITECIHHKHIYRDYVGVDACMANLMRPGMYGAYHHITVLGKEDAAADRKVDVVGSLCENNDKFAIERELPAIERGDLLAIHDAGAHGHAMGFQYNGKLRSAELLLQENGDVRQIRRAETYDDYFATLDFAPFGG
ncbi:diaminopimelate decarboxylase family protein [Fuerstiella marisgermanici]|uniref:Diaminopimelate decarboxylase n=1 Tax=Fuerstiella marisgermanici TaxID=1891926 RepID=A0A1P8WBJ2_9PLAN|nr:diaminopimelate decarboxylase [Fuerstiella marisgermanici]APZ91429.1 Diaminopimelate decarboxylase [Fuerstiella marisgermanici]